MITFDDIESLRGQVWSHLEQVLNPLGFGPKPLLRLRSNEWKCMLLTNNDKGYMIHGKVYSAKGKSIGCGVVEISLEESPDEK